MIILPRVATADFDREALATGRATACFHTGNPTRVGTREVSFRSDGRGAGVRKGWSWALGSKCCEQAVFAPCNYYQMAIRIGCYSRQVGWKGC